MAKFRTEKKVNRLDVRGQKKLSKFLGTDSPHIRRGILFVCLKACHVSMS